MCKYQWTQKHGKKLGVLTEVIAWTFNMHITGQHSVLARQKFLIAPYPI